MKGCFSGKTGPPFCGRYIINLLYVLTDGNYARFYEWRQYEGQNAIHIRPKTSSMIMTPHWMEAENPQPSFISFADNRKKLPPGEKLRGA